MTASREEEIVAEKLVNEGNLPKAYCEVLIIRIQDLEEELVHRLRLCD
jgi:hypothetical protein